MSTAKQLTYFRAARPRDVLSPIKTVDEFVAQFLPGIKVSDTQRLLLHDVLFEKVSHQTRCFAYCGDAWINLCHFVHMSASWDRPRPNFRLALGPNQHLYRHGVANGLPIERCAEHKGATVVEALAWRVLNINVRQGFRFAETMLGLEGQNIKTL